MLMLSHSLHHAHCLPSPFALFTAEKGWISRGRVREENPQGLRAAERSVNTAQCTNARRQLQQKQVGRPDPLIGRCWWTALLALNKALQHAWISRWQMNFKPLLSSLSLSPHTLGRIKRRLSGIWLTPGLHRVILNQNRRAGEGQKHAAVAASDLMPIKQQRQHTNCKYWAVISHGDFQHSWKIDFRDVPTAFTGNEQFRLQRIWKDFCIQPS